MPQFFQFPLFLLDLPISTLSKIVYMILYDRSRLSMLNSWVTDGKVYIIYPIAEIAKTIHRSLSTVKTAMNELEQYGLLERQSGGFSSPNHLFVRIPDIEPKMKPCESEIKPCDGQISAPAAAGFLATNKVIESSYSNKDSDMLSFGRYKNVFLTKDDYENLR